MRDLRPALRSWLLADAAVAAVVSTRVYPIQLPQGQRQASIVYNRISERGDYHTQGPSGLIETRMQIDAWAPLVDDASDLADKIKDRMDDLRHSTVSFGTASPIEFVIVQGSFLDSGREDYDSSADMHRMSRDYLIWYASGD